MLNIKKVYQREQTIMKHIHLFLRLVASFLAVLAFSVPSYGNQNSLKFGDEIHLQNAHSSWGSFLDTNGHCSETHSGSKYCVSTSATKNRSVDTGTWRILSASGKSIGDVVLFGDEIHIQNKHKSWSTYLDTNGHCDKKHKGSKYCVSAAPTKTRSRHGTGIWRLVSAEGKSLDVTALDSFHIQNQTSNWGSFLDTNGHCNKKHKGSKYCVSTSPTKARSALTGTWRAIKSDEFENVTITNGSEGEKTVVTAAPIASDSGTTSQTDMPLEQISPVIGKVIGG